MSWDKTETDTIIIDDIVKIEVEATFHVNDYDDSEILIESISFPEELPDMYSIADGPYTVMEKIRHALEDRLAEIICTPRRRLAEEANA